jgi:hypothetical protein
VLTYICIVRAWPRVGVSTAVLLHQTMQTWINESRAESREQSPMLLRSGANSLSVVFVTGGLGAAASCTCVR